MATTVQSRRDLPTATDDRLPEPRRRRGLHGRMPIETRLGRNGSRENGRSSRLVDLHRPGHAWHPASQFGQKLADPFRQAGCDVVQGRGIREDRLPGAHVQARGKSERTSHRDLDGGPLVGQHLLEIIEVVAQKGSCRASGMVGGVREPPSARAMINRQIDEEGRRPPDHLATGSTGR